MNIWLIITAVLVSVLGFIAPTVINTLYDETLKAKVIKYKKTSFIIVSLMIIICAILGVVSSQKNDGTTPGKSTNISAKEPVSKEDFHAFRSSEVKLPDSIKQNQIVPEKKNDDADTPQEKVPVPSRQVKKNPTENISFSYAENLTPSQQIVRFLEAENAIKSAAGIQNILNFYSFPMRKYFKYTVVSSEHLYNIYKLAYLENYLYHKITNYDDGIKVISLPDGRTRVEVTFQFETSKNADGANSKVMQVSNAYVFNADGRIESIGLAADKSF